MFIPLYMRSYRSNRAACQGISQLAKTMQTNFSSAQDSSTSFCKSLSAQNLEVWSASCWWSLRLHARSSRPSTFSESSAAYPTSWQCFSKSRRIWECSCCSIWSSFFAFHSISVYSESQIRKCMASIRSTSSRRDTMLTNTSMRRRWIGHGLSIWMISPRTRNGKRINMVCLMLNIYLSI